MERLEEAIEHVLSGTAICFLGAGFSLGARDSGGTNKVPSTSKLTDELWSIADTPGESGGTLSDIAEFCASSPELASKLRQHLIRRLTHCAPNEEQKQIVQAPWRAIFSTNFDDIIERVDRKPKLQIVTPSTQVKTLSSHSKPLYYLHGRALDLVETDVDPLLVISESNYLNLKDRNTDLYAAFLNEVHSATRVFFVGYSLKDMEIAKRLFAISDIVKSKSFVICGPSEGAVARSRLEKFGEVHAIGAEGLAATLEQATKTGPEERLRKTYPAFLRPLPRPEVRSEVTKDDIDRLVLSGEFDISCYLAQERGDDPANIYCISRNAAVDGLFASAATGSVNRFLVTSDIGNGKTTFLRQLSAAAIIRGFDVYWVDSTLNEIFEDIDAIVSSNNPKIFIVDDLIRYRVISEYIGKRLNSSAIIVCGTRDSFDEAHFATTSQMLGGVIREIDLNTMNTDQLLQWDRLLERWGYWEDRINLEPSSRISFLQSDCGAENRSIVVSIFRTSYIANKIDNIVSYFLNKNPQHVRSFVAILIASLCQKHVLWERIVDWLNIDSEGLRREIQREQVFDFLSGKRNWYQFTSTQLSDYIFKRYDFDPQIIVEVYTTIVRETAHSANDPRSGFDAKENLKELMKFRFLSRLFGDSGSAIKSIESVYTRLSKVSRIRDNDQFWLQYAMSCMERGNLVDAETYLNTALGIAKKRGDDYSPFQIVDQKIRLFLMKNSLPSSKLNETEISYVIDELRSSFGKSDLLMIYPLRSATFILQLLDEKIDDLTIDVRRALLEILDTMKVAVAEGDLAKAQKGETKKLREEVRRARLVLQNA